ncbi:MAG: ATP-binding protein [Chloroflexota bacterium]
MMDRARASLLRTLAAALDVPVQSLGDYPDEIRVEIVDALGEDSPSTASVAIGDDRLVAHRPGTGLETTIVAGPLAGRDPEAVGETLRLAARHLNEIGEIDRNRLELASELEVVSHSVLAVTGALEIDLVLRRLVDLARDLAGARYAAIGVPGEDGDLVTFVTSGLSAEQEAKIGELPKGRGLLGLLLTEQRTLRLANIADHPASAGFPEHHPPMRSFLGVPIMSRGRTLGNLYLTEKRYGQEFTAQDARKVELLSRHAAVAIENANLYERVESQQLQLRGILENMPEGILVAEPNPERIVIANSHASQLLGWEIPEPMPLEAWVEQDSCFNADSSPLRPDDIPLFRSLRSGETVERVDLTVVRPDGVRVALLVNSSPLRDSSGNIVAAISVFQDITEIKDAEQLKDDFLSLVSHELRTPLTTIQGGATLLERDGERLSPDLRQEMLADISNESRRLAILIENMVQLASVRAGRMAMSVEPVLVRSVIEQAVSATHQYAPEREIQIEIEPQLLALADGERIDQVLRNLLHNAIKYAPDNTPITVNARRADGEVEITVRDRGPGFDPDDVENLFDRFQRGQSARASATPGMGLGLYLCRQVIQAHGGRIWIENAPDGGARISFTLPDAGDDL